LAVPDRAVVTAKPLGPQATRVSDRSLDEFAAPPTDGDPDAEPSVPTMRWSPGGAVCDGCGAVVSRRWLDTETRTHVCADCTGW
jgi:hypothetical protein